MIIKTEERNVYLLRSFYQIDLNNDIIKLRHMQYIKELQNVSPICRLKKFAELNEKNMGEERPKVRTKGAWLV